VCAQLPAGLGRLAELCNLLVSDVSEGRGVSGFVEAALARVRVARARLATACAAEDAFAEAQAAEELEDALRVARDHGVDTGVEAEGS
ncbi:hypothetical protein ACFUMI_29250, partial [Streptomyces sp. NPDC057273]